MIKWLDYHTDEEIQEKQVCDDVDKNRKQDVIGFWPLLWLHVLVRWVNLRPHHWIVPSFGGLDAKEADNRADDAVEVEVSVDPFSAIVDTVPFCLDENLSLFVG